MPAILYRGVGHWRVVEDADLDQARRDGWYVLTPAGHPPASDPSSEEVPADEAEPTEEEPIETAPDAAAPAPRREAPTRKRKGSNA
jgi:hypothetical protein